MIRTRRAALAPSVKRFSLATNAERICAEIMLKQESGARWRLNLMPSRSMSDIALHAFPPILPIGPANAFKSSFRHYCRRDNDAFRISAVSGPADDGALHPALV